MDFSTLKNPPKKFRPVPFWSWNERLDTEETKRQVRLMNDAGLGGFFMHARGGLLTDYMSNEWFDNVKAAIDEGEKHGMYPWGYDENGWPSGFGAGAVNDLGIIYQQKYLRMEMTDEPQKSDNTIINLPYEGRNLHFYFDVNPFYVDTLDPDVTEEFIRVTHKRYKKKLGDMFTSMTGFFTDEPQVSRGGIPWSFVMEKEYMKAYGEPLAPALPALFLNTKDFRKVRYRFWKLVRNLFAENFMGKIHEWCKKNGSHLTGHMVIEEGFKSHIMANGACPPSYEYMDIPGMDHLGRSLASIQTEMQLSSVANQLGKKQILSETFALSGWNVSFEDLRTMFEAQLNHGINLLCQHLEGYSLRGIRKRDYPASLFAHQPWWSDYKIFNDIVSRIGMLVAEGDVNYNILVLNTVESGWIYFDENSRDLLDMRLCRDMKETMQSLEDSQLQYHLGDARIIERYGKVADGKLEVGSQKYTAVIVPPCPCLGEATLVLLEKFADQGGKIIFCEQVPEYASGEETDRFVKLAGKSLFAYHKNVSAAVPKDLRRISVSYKNREKEPVSVLIRDFKDNGMTMYYIFNPLDVTHDISVSVKGKSASLFNPVTGDENKVYFEEKNGDLTVKTRLERRGSVILFVYGDNRCTSLDTWETKPLKSVSDMLKGEWTVKSADPNCLTLDYCDLYFDGKKEAENIPVSDVQEKACAFERPVKTDVVFKFNIKDKNFKKCDLVLETPEIFTICVNGDEVKGDVTGYLHDVSFKTVDIYSYVKEGENEVKLSCNFVQRPETYESIKKSPVFESEKNKLSYDMEIEAIYISGDFEVRTDAKFTKLERRGLRTSGGFYLCGAKGKVSDGNMAEQGYPFFAGKMTFEKTVTLTKEECTDRSFTLSQLCSNITELNINGSDAGKIMWHPYSLDISKYLKPGENVFRVTVTGNLRNMLGPFHLAEGESFAVSPRSFFHESPIWLKGKNPSWVDSYCFVEYGLFF